MKEEDSGEGADLGPGWGKTGFYPVELVPGTTQGEVVLVGYLG
jgi:hypothetical protein